MNTALQDVCSSQSTQRRSHQQVLEDDRRASPADTINKFYRLDTLIGLLSGDKKEEETHPQQTPSTSSTRLKVPPMLSSPIAEIVMCAIDTWITSLYPEDIIIYRRYIDDIFCICTDSQISHILASLNSYHTNINFTVEKENNGILPFLDIKNHKDRR
ncbi:ACSF2 [Cordylochernes scorpioides]|uniref:ACSF2 n=1 Tax=Cordylochernes scorpioides TaxID=51811 RepID=A0ABY6L552_9ARAC|nr:ACSF2 [Cordylochernes scorpioides]